jgi:hypothetical protein
MDSAKQILAGIVIFFILVAPCYAESIPSFSGQSSGAVFLGVEGENGLHGGASALSIFIPFQYYAAAQVMAGGTTSPEVSYTLDPIHITNYVVDTFNKDTSVDNFLFYLVGHGGIDKIYTFSDGTTDYYVSPNDIINALSILPESINKIVILDACHSSSFLNDLETVNNITVFTSTKTDNQISYYHAVTGISLFSHVISNFITEKVTSTFFKSFSTTDLKNYIENNFWNEAYKNTPARTLDFGDLVYMTKENFDFGYYQSPSYSTPVPEPSTIFLFGIGIVGIAFTRRKKKLV